MAINACLTPVCTMHGLAVTTVEGIGAVEEKLHPVQERIAKSHGSQCGFCTPGIVMSMYALLRDKNRLVYTDIDTALQGNLCRCTGYRPIIEGFKTFMEGWEMNYGEPNSLCAMGKDCCLNRKDNESSLCTMDENSCSSKKNKASNELFKRSVFQPYDRTQEPIFPPELKLNTTFGVSYLAFKYENVVWIRPNTLNDLLLLKSKVPHSKIVMGNTEIGVEMKFKKKVYPVLISPISIMDMHFCEVSDEGIIVGATTSLTELLNYLRNYVQNLKDPSKGQVFEAIKYMLHWFAGTQVRNVASLVGNIVTASPISDLNPILMSVSATLNVSSFKRGNRKVVIDEKFFKSYRQIGLQDDEVVVSVKIPFTEPNQYVKAYKQARRRDDDISIVTAAFNVRFNDKNIVTAAKICFGGMGPTTKCATYSSSIIIGHYWDNTMLNAVFDSLNDELFLDHSVPGGMAEYRKSLCLSLFFRFYLFVQSQLIKINGYQKITKHISSGAEEIPVQEPISSQCFEIINDNKIYDTVGKPLYHVSALKQATGEAIYCDDIPHIEGELYLTLVFSSEAHAKIKSIDATKAMQVPGVVAFLSSADLDDEHNKLGPIFRDEEIFCRKTVTSRACVIGAIVGTSEKAARKGKNLVIVNYERLSPVIVTLEDAIAHQSYFNGYPRKLIKGDVNEAFTKSSHVIDGKVRSGAQEHFYLETISAYAIRKEDELEIVATSQNPSEVAVSFY